MYEKEVNTVELAIVALGGESDPSLLSELESERLAGATGLECYGITKAVFERFLAEKDLTPATRSALRKAIKAIVRIFTK